MNGGWWRRSPIPARRSMPRWHSRERSPRQPPISVAMTKLTVNRLAHALDDLAGHMDVDQFALASLTEDHKEGVEAFLKRRKPRFQGALTRSFIPRKVEGSPSASAGHGRDKRNRAARGRADPTRGRPCLRANSCARPAQSESRERPRNSRWPPNRHSIVARDDNMCSIPGGCNDAVEYSTHAYERRLIDIAFDR